MSESAKIALEVASDAIWSALEREKTGNIVSPSKISNRADDDSVVSEAKKILADLADFLADKSVKPMREDQTSAVIYAHRSGEDSVRKVQVLREHENYYGDVLKVHPEGSETITIKPNANGKWTVEFLVPTGSGTQLQSHTLA